MAHLGLSLHTVTGNCMLRKNMFFSVWGMLHFQVLQSNYYLIIQWTFNDHIFFFCSLLLMVILDDCFSHSSWYLLRKQFLISSLDWKQNKKKYERKSEPTERISSYQKKKIHVLSFTLNFWNNLWWFLSMFKNQCKPKF